MIQKFNLFRLEERKTGKWMRSSISMSLECPLWAEHCADVNDFVAYAY